MTYNFLFIPACRGSAVYDAETIDAIEPNTSESKKPLLYAGGIISLLITYARLPRQRGYDAETIDTIEPNISESKKPRPVGGVGAKPLFLFVKLGN